jgi:DNA polymerase-3 subunit gamma/tau
MSYRVLARAYRSNTFDEVVGQETIATTLKNAIGSGRVHHGYLFTGTRGVGKTSMARILAKALNCSAAEAPTISPCCACASCVAIAAGEDIDVVEIDAASNTGVDNIRELRSNTTLRPARSRYKVYIIDEVHMLSAGAFNALLKTLEEPPPHIKFILATTEAQKVPATIQSRCQRFDFRAIDASAIAEHLQCVIKAEGLEAEEGVLRRVARLANGSMRDALSLLDKLLSYEPTCLTTEIANQVIPPPHDELASAVIDAVARRDAGGALQALDRALGSGRTPDRFCDHLIDHVRTLMLLRVCGDDTDLVDVAGSVRPALVAQAAHFDAPTYVYMITLLEELRRNVRNSGSARALADAAVVRLAMAQQFTDLGPLLARLEGNDTALPSGKPTGTAKKKEAASPDVRPPEPGSGQLPAARYAEPGTETAHRAGLVPSHGVDSPHGFSSEPVSRASRSVTPSSGRPSLVPERLAQPQQGAGIEPRGLARGGRSLSSSERARAAEDELVLRVKEAVDGMLLDVRAVAPTCSPDVTPSSAAADEGDSAREDADASSALME